MKKIFLTTVSCFALTYSCALAMEPENFDRQLSIKHIKQTATVAELREYIYEALKTESIQEGINIFDDFVKGLRNTVFTKETKTIQDHQNKKQSFTQLQSQYIQFVTCFSTSFNENLMRDAQVPVLDQSNQKVVHAEGYLKSYPHHEHFYRAFQDLSNQFFSIREQCLGVSLVSDFEILKDNPDRGYQVFLFKDKEEYVPIPLISKRPCSSEAVLYGSPSVPQKQFTFRKGTLIEDSGYILSPFDDFLKLTIQYGKTASNPFTSSAATLRIAYDFDIPLMNALKAQFGEGLSNQTHFITFPTTQEDQDVLELLFLEDLMEESKKEINNSSLTFLKFILDEVKEENTTIEDRIEELKEKILNSPEKLLIENATINNKQNIQQKQKKKTKGTPNKNQPKKHNNNAQKQKSTQSSSTKPLENEKNKKAEELLAKVKQEGRVKYREILGIMNTVRSTTKNEEIFNKFATIGRKGSHINFHLEDGQGLTLVKKHGKDDLTYPAKQVNYFSKRLINAMFSID